jgi:hypothetical protein
MRIGEGVARADVDGDGDGVGATCNMKQDTSLVATMTFTSRV